MLMSTFYLTGYVRIYCFCRSKHNFILVSDNRNKIELHEIKHTCYIKVFCVFNMYYYAIKHKRTRTLQKRIESAPYIFNVWTIVLTNVKRQYSYIFSAISLNLKFVKNEHNYGNIEINIVVKLKHHIGTPIACVFDHK